MGGENFHKAIAARLIMLGFDAPILFVGSNPKKSASVQFFDEYQELNFDKIRELQKEPPKITEIDLNCKHTFSDHTQSKFITKPKNNFKKR